MRKQTLKNASLIVVLLLALVLMVSIGFLFLSNNDIVVVDATSILNYDDSLGKFQDLTKAEVKDYYKTLTKGLKGDDLLNAIQPILKAGQRKLKYASGNETSKNWDGYYLLERDWEKSPLENSEITADGKNYKRNGIYINPLYCSDPIFIPEGESSGINENVKYERDGVLKNSSYKNCIDREHVLPKSFGFNVSGDGYKKLTAGCDMQNLHAGEHYGNSLAHNNLPYGNVTQNKKSQESCINGEIVGYTGQNDNGIDVFEPIAEDKGDIARSVFYMCARYHYYEDLGDGDETPAITLSNTAEKGTTITPIQTKDNPVAYGMLDDLLLWHKDDPVSEFEIHRNNLCYNIIQGNRNPFVDYPDWVEVAFDKNAEQGVDLSQDNGVEVPAFITVTSKRSEIYRDDILTNDNFSFAFTVEDKTATPLTFEQIECSVLSGGKEKVVTDFSTFLFNEVGNWIIRFKYTRGEDVFVNDFTLRVLKPYDIKIANSASIETLSQVKKGMGLDSLEIYFYNRGVKTKITDYDVKVVNKDGQLVSTSKDYVFQKTGKYIVRLSKTIGDEVISTSFEVTVIPETWVLAVSTVAIVLAIVIIIVVVVVVEKKKKRA